MKIDDIKQLCAVFCDETNVYNVRFYAGTSEKGPIELNYDSSNNEFTYVLNGKTIEKKPSDAAVKLVWELYARK